MIELVMYDAAESSQDIVHYLDRVLEGLLTWDDPSKVVIALGDLGDWKTFKITIKIEEIS